MTPSPPNHRRRVERAIQTLVLWMFSSVVIHFALGLFLYRGAVARAQAQEQFFRGENGDNGRSRTGGSTVDFENAPIQPPPQAQPQPPAAPQTPPPVSEPPVATAPSEDPITVRPRPQHPRVIPTPPIETHVETVAPRVTPTAAVPVVPSPPVEGPTAPETTGGARTGSVGEQRAMLPPARRCNDPVAGTWRAHKYTPSGHDWVIFTLRIDRDSANHLSGSILARIWTGLSMDSRPPGRCAGGLMGLDYLIRQPASGEYTPTGVVLFHGETWETERAYCQSAYFGYNLDSFDGTIDQERQEFQSRNNDGGRDRDAPYVFRRIGCLAGDSTPTATTTVSGETDSGTVAH